MLFKIEFEGSKDDLEFFINTEVYEDLTKENNSYFKDLSELRLKESDRVKSVSESLTKLGVKNYTSKISGMVE